MEIVRYRAGEAIRWLKVGGEAERKQAEAKGKNLFQQSGTDQRPVVENIASFAGSVYKFTRGAYADLKAKLAEASEYVLQAEHFDISRGQTIKSIRYNQVASISIKGDKITITLDKGHLTIKPIASIVAGSVRAPVGWTRNGIEVPYELLAEELAARCGVNLEVL